MKSKLAVSKALYLKPLLVGLDKPDSPFEVFYDFPALNAIKLSKRSENVRNAFLSPIDYAKYGGEYCIVPEICVSSYQSRNTIELIIRSDVSNIENVGIDVRYTSEIILANIILKEKYKSLQQHEKLQFVPIKKSLDLLLQEVDAVLVVNDVPRFIEEPGVFRLDLVEEWTDMTDLPYVFGFWVGRENETLESELQALKKAKQEWLNSKQSIIQKIANESNMDYEAVDNYLTEFSYDFGESQKESISEFFYYAYCYGIIGDIPDIRFFTISDT